MIEKIAKPLINEVIKSRVGKTAFNNLPKLDLNKVSPFVNKMETRNMFLEGKSHPETGVVFEKEKVKTGIIRSKEGVFPKFNSQFDAKLPKELYKESDREQFKECNNQLKTSIESNTELKSKFSGEQSQQIEAGRTPRGYTWHHSENVGTMQLVDSETHSKTGHTGGKAVWGGGSEHR